MHKQLKNCPYCS